MSEVKYSLCSRMASVSGIYLYLSICLSIYLYIYIYIYIYYWVIITDINMKAAF